MKHKSGFTLIELLVVIAIIALLLAILMPSLQIVKKKASTAVCLTNTKNLSLAWFMYQQDNAGWLIGGRTSKKYPWIKNPIDETGTTITGLLATSPQVTDEDEIRGIEAGYLYSYIEAHNAYHCPADKRKSLFDGSRVYVSYSIPRCLNADFDNERKKFGQISMPSMRYNFVENADERNWNMGGSFPLWAPGARSGSRTWQSDPEWAWWGPLAVNHGDTSVLGFCDGHSEPHKWVDETTKKRVNKLRDTGTTSYGTQKPLPGEVDDIQYMAQGWATRP